MRNALRIIAFAAALALVVVQPGRAQSQDGTEYGEPDEAVEGQTGDTRLFLSPTARPLGNGRGYVSVYEIFLPFVAYGIGDRGTVVGGVTINPGNGRLMYGGAKLTVSDGPRTSFAVGALGLGVVGDNSPRGAALLHAVGTRGGRRGSVTAGLAFGTADGEIDGNPALIIGGDLRLGNAARLVTENYVFIGLPEAILVSLGLRVGSDRLTGDFAFFTVPSLVDDLDDFPLLPWIGLTYSFGH